MTGATSLTANYRSGARKVRPDDGDGPPSWRVDGVTVSVLDDNTLQLAGAYRQQPELRVEIYNGELRFPLEDLVPLILERLDLREVAEMICVNEEARASVLDSLARRYNDHCVSDDDRRAWVAKVKGAVHDAALDQLVTAMTSIERAASQVGYDACRSIAFGNVLRHELRDAGMDPEEIERRVARWAPKPYLVSYGAFTQEQDVWGAARDYWREQARAIFLNVNADAQGQAASKPAAQAEGEGSRAPHSTSNPPRERSEQGETA